MSGVSRLRESRTFYEVTWEDAKARMCRSFIYDHVVVWSQVDLEHTLHVGGWSNGCLSEDRRLNEWGISAMTI